MPIDLNQPLTWTLALQSGSAQGDDMRALLSDLQGNILKGHGRDFAAHVFLTFDAHQAEAARRFVRERAASLHSALDQLLGTVVFQSTGSDAGLFETVLLSAAGYKALQVKDDQIPAEAVFRDGLASRVDVLKDKPVATWDAPLRTAVHALVILAHDDRFQLDAAVAALTRSVAGTAGAVAVRHVEIGIARHNADGHGIEHFGYVDGRSQPLMLAEDIAKEQANGGTDQWDPSIPASQVLVPCPGGDPEFGFGSYFVFRKLEQNVRGFKTRERDLARELAKQWAENPGDRAGAYVVGRFENGTPIIQRPREAPMGSASTSVPNNFNFDADPAGRRCPFAAHIRKTNPRDATIASNARLMARRGIPYGVRKDDPNDGDLDNKPRDGVGLLFMAYQSSIADQFEFTQASWANNAGFHFRAPDQPVGIDPVIGQPHSGGAQRYPLTYGGNHLSAPFDFSGFVTMKGGEYFFAPCLSFLRRLT